MKGGKIPGGRAGSRSPGIVAAITIFGGSERGNARERFISAGSNRTDLDTRANLDGFRARRERPTAFVENGARISLQAVKGALTIGDALQTFS